MAQQRAVLLDTDAQAALVEDGGIPETLVSWVDASARVEVYGDTVQLRELKVPTRNARFDSTIGTSDVLGPNGGWGMYLKFSSLANMQTTLLRNGYRKMSGHGTPAVFSQYNSGALVETWIRYI